MKLGRLSTKIITNWHFGFLNILQAVKAPSLGIMKLREGSLQLYQGTCGSAMGNWIKIVSGLSSGQCALSGIVTFVMLSGLIILMISKYFMPGRQICTHHIYCNVHSTRQRILKSNFGRNKFCACLSCQYFSIQLW